MNTHGPAPSGAAPSKRPVSAPEHSEDIEHTLADDPEDDRNREHDAPDADQQLDEHQVETLIPESSGGVERPTSGPSRSSSRIAWPGLA